MEREMRGKRKRPVRLTSEQMEWFVSVMNYQPVSWVQEELKKRYGIVLSKTGIYKRKNYYQASTRKDREMVCKQCGTIITVRAYQDRRTTYCSKRCEKRYWKKTCRAET